MSLISEFMTNNTLRAYFEFRQGHSRDLSINGNILTASGSPRGVHKEKGIAVAFSGGPNQFDSTNGILPIGTEGTIVFYYRRNAYKAGTRLLFSDDALGANYEPRTFSSDDGRISFTMAFGTDGTKSLNYDEGSYYNDTLVVWTWRKNGANTDLFLYADGVLVASDSNAGTVYTTPDISAKLTVNGFEGHLYTYLSVSEYLEADKAAALTQELIDMKFPTKTISKSKSNLLNNKEYALEASYNMNLIGNKVIDLTGNNRNFTKTGKVQNVRDNFGKSLYFLGEESKLELSSDPIGTGDVTLLFTFKLDDLTNNKIMLYNGKFYCYLKGSNKKLALLSNGTTTVFSNIISHPENSIYRVVITRTSSGLANFYLNGEPYATLNQNSGTPVGGTLNPRIGDPSETLQIYSMQIYKRLLSDAEIREDYKNIADKAIPFKTGWGVWDTNGSQGGSVGDYLGNSPFKFGDTSGRHTLTTDTIDGKICKVIQCDTAGLLYLDWRKFMGTTEAAYGKWECYVNHATASTTTLGFACINADVTAGYGVQISSSEEVSVEEFGSGSLITGGTVNAAEWNKITMERRFDNIFTLKINDLQIGTAPDTTTTTANYLVFDLEAGDKIALADINGDHAITKYALA